MKPMAIYSYSNIVPVNIVGTIAIITVEAIILSFQLVLRLLQKMKPMAIYSFSNILPVTTYYTIAIITIILPTFIPVRL